MSNRPVRPYKRRLTPKDREKIARRLAKPVKPYKRKPPPMQNAQAKCRHCGTTWVTGAETVTFRCPGCNASVAGPELRVEAGAAPSPSATPTTHEE